MVPQRTSNPLKRFDQIAPFRSLEFDCSSKLTLLHCSILPHNSSWDRSSNSARASLLERGCHLYAHGSLLLRTTSIGSTNMTKSITKSGTILLDCCTVVRMTS